MLSVSAILFPAPKPCGAVHITCVADVQEVVEHTVPEIVIDGVGSAVAKFSPISEIDAPSVLGVFIGLAQVTIGESKVNDASCVPTSVEIERLTSTDLP